MTKIKSCYKNKINLGAQQSYKNLTMLPLIASYSISRDCLTMIERLSNCNTKQNRSVYNTIRNRANNRITASWDYIEQFARVDDQIGAIFLVNGKLAGMVCFRSTETFKKSFIKIVEWYSKMADEEYDPKNDLTSSKFEMINFLKAPIDSGIKIQSAARMG
jgi:hypothetical protein